MLTEQDVVTAYKLFLGRTPESKEVVDNFVRNADFDRLRTDLAGSSEFAERLRQDLSLLGVSTDAVLLTSQVRAATWRLQQMATARLPLQRKSVLIAGETALRSIAFFLDRQCAVSLLVSTANYQKFSALTKHLPDRITLEQTDLRELAATNGSNSKYADIVYADLPHVDVVDFREWVVDIAGACQDMAILNADCVVSRGDEIFKVRGQREGIYSVPSQVWLTTRLREHFPFVYRLKLDSQGPLLAASIEEMLRPLSVCSDVYIASHNALPGECLEELG